MSPQKLHLEKRGYDDLSRGLCLFLNSTLNQNQPKEHFMSKSQMFSFPLGVLTLWCLCHGAIATHAQCAVYAPVALQTPHAVHSSTTSSLLFFFFVLFFFVLISNLLLDLFLYGSSESLLKSCLFINLYTVCMTYYLIVIILCVRYLLFSYGFTEWQSQTQRN